VQRGVAYLLQGFPDRNYAISCQLMASGALGEQAPEGRMEALLEALLDLRVDREGAWGYPHHPSISVDLSNTQYAALGLRAAQQSGVTVKKKTWTELVEGVLEHREEPRTVPWQDPSGVSSTGERAIAGFRYLRGGSYAPTSSMTAAAVSILALCAEGLGPRAPAGVRRDIAQARQTGLAWLDHHFAVDKNPGGKPAWLFYYLYGLERVGSLLGTDRIGAHEWYWEGAEFLVKRQGAGGEWATAGPTVWPPQPMIEANTCFALLFLNKATAPSSGPSRNPRARVWAAEDPAADVQVRATGNSQLAMWVGGLGEKAIERFTFREGLVEGLRVVRVEWLVGDEVVATVAGDPGRGWQGERFPYRHSFSRNGTFPVKARVVVLDPRAEEGDVEEIPLESAAMPVEVDDVLEDWMLVYARTDATNLLREIEFRAHASTTRSGYHPAGDVADGLQFTSWRSAAGDASPQIVLELSRVVRVQRILLSHVDASPRDEGRTPRVTRIRIRVNREPRGVEYDLPHDGQRKSVLELDARITVRRLEVTVLEVEGKPPGGSSVGFAEIELQRR